MDTIKICIAEKDEQQRKELVEGLSQYMGISITAVTGDGLEVMRMVRETAPEVLITNLFLPHYDAYAIMDQIASFQNKPKIIILSSLTMESAIQKAFAKGADEYVIKPADMTLLASKVYEVTGHTDMVMQTSSGFGGTPSHNSSAVTIDEERIRQNISTLFLRIGLPAHLLGYRFAQQAVFKLVEDPMLMKNRTKVLYPMIAAMNKTTSFCVERAIRHVITLTWDRGLAKRYEQEYGHNSRLHLPEDKPTSGEFIALLAEYLRPRLHS